jgi:surface polysaccharide O-acyltransferase-like enzyme
MERLYIWGLFALGIVFVVSALLNKNSETGASTTSTSSVAAIGAYLRLSTMESDSTFLLIACHNYGPV